MWVLLPAVVAIVAPPPQAPWMPIARPCVAGGRVSSHAKMGFFDDLKGAFDNDPRLANKKESKGQASAKKQKMMQQRKEYDKSVQNSKTSKGEIQTGNDRLDEILSGWTWK